MILVVTTCRRTHASAFFFFNDTATTEIYTLSLHDALPILIRGKLKLVLEKDGQRFETILTDRDVVSVPPGVYREEINIGDEDALMCVMLGAKKPITPTYPPEHPLAKIKR